jgi:hypothetical protein
MFDWLFGSKQTLPGEFDPALMREAIDFMLKRIDPRLMLVSDYQQRLLEPMATTMMHLRDIVDGLPESRPCHPESWAQDAYLRAFFAAPDSLEAAVNRSQELREYFEANPTQDSVHALLGMRVRRKQVFGVALKGEVMQHDVQKTVWSFEDHKLRFIGRDSQSLRRAIAEGVLDQLAQYMLEQIEGEQAQRSMLAQERAALKTRQQLLQRQGHALTAMLGDEAAPSQQDQERVQQLLDENDQALQQMGAAHEVLEKHLAHLQRLLAQPEQTIPVHQQSVRLDQMNTEVEESPTVVSNPLAFTVIQVAANPPQERTFMLVLIRREQLKTSSALLDDAFKLL